MKAKTVILSMLPFSLLFLGLFKKKEPAFEITIPKETQEKTIEEKLDSLPPSEVYTFLDSKKVKTLTEDYTIKKGITEENFEEWLQLLIASQNLLQKYPVHHSHLATLKQVSVALQKTIASLHIKYSATYEGKAYFRTVKINPEKLQAVRNKDELSNVKKKLEELSVEALSISEGMKEGIGQKRLENQSYKFGGPFRKMQDASDVLKDYQKFLQNASTATERQLEDLVQPHIHSTKKDPTGSSREVAAKTFSLIDKIKLIAHILELKRLTLEQSLKKSPKKNLEETQKIIQQMREKAKLRDLANQFIERFGKLHPKALQELLLKELATTDNKPAVIVFTIASALYDLAQKLKGEIDDILAVS